MSIKEDQKIGLLIVDDNPATIDNLKKMLYFEADVEVIGTALDAEEAVAKTVGLRPDIVLMDVNMPKVDGITATRLVRAEVPNQTVVVMSVQRETEYVRRAMIAGASDYLAKPFTSDELVNSLREVWANHQRDATREPRSAETDDRSRPDGEHERVGRVVVVFSPKGGLGRTTVAVNLATAIRVDTGLAVALADLSMAFGDVGAMLDVQGRSITDLLDHVEGLDAQALATTLVTHSSGLRVLLAPPRPELAELVTGEHVTTILAQLRRMFDFTIIDTAPSLHDVTLAALDAADEIIVPATLELLVLKNIRFFLETVEALEYRDKRISIVVNRVNGSAGIRKQDVEVFLRQKVAATIVSDWKLASFAQNAGVPFVISNRRAPISADLFALASLVSRGAAGAVPDAAERTRVKTRGIAGVTRHLIARPA